MNTTHSDIEVAQGTDPANLVHGIKTKLAREFPASHYIINYNSIALSVIPGRYTFTVAIAYTVYKVQRGY